MHIYIFMYIYIHTYYIPLSLHECPIFPLHRPFALRRSTTSPCPARAAQISAVQPSRSAAFTTAREHSRSCAREVNPGAGARMDRL